MNCFVCSYRKTISRGKKKFSPTKFEWGRERKRNRERKIEKKKKKDRNEKRKVMIFLRKKYFRTKSVSFKGKSLVYSLESFFFLSSSLFFSFFRKEKFTESIWKWWKTRMTRLSEKSREREIGKGRGRKTFFERERASEMFHSVKEMTDKYQTWRQISFLWNREREGRERQIKERGKRKKFLTQNSRESETIFIFFHLLSLPFLSHSLISQFNFSLSLSFFSIFLSIALLLFIPKPRQCLLPSLIHCILCSGKFQFHSFHPQSGARERKCGRRNSKERK